MGRYGFRPCCECEERKKPAEKRDWVVIARNSSCSAFNGYRTLWSDRSLIRCRRCGKVWRTGAKFVAKLKDGDWS